MIQSIRHSIPIVLVLLAVLGLLPGCVVTERVYLNQVEVEGPAALPPVIPPMEPSEAGAIALIPHFGVNTERKFSGRVEPVGTTPQSEGENNLVWRTPAAEGGLDVQVSVSPSVALLVGGTVGGVDGRVYGNFRGGLGVFTVKENAAFRVDAGLQLTSIRSRVRATVETDVNSIFGDARYRSNFDDIGDETSLSPYIGFTLNTTSKTAPLNFVLNLGVSGQPLFNMRPTHPDLILGPGDLVSAADRIRETATIYSVTPALSVGLGGGSQVLVGSRVIGYFGIDEASPDISLRPFVQFVMQL